MRVHSLVVDLRSGVGISVTVTCHLPRPPDVMIADGLPPDAGRSLLHSLYALTYTVRIYLVLQFILGVAVPALHQVDHVEHDQEGQRDVDVSIGAGTVVVHHRFSFVSTVEGEPCDLGHLAPGHHPDAAVHQHGQQQAFPVGFLAQGFSNRLFLRMLLQNNEEKNTRSQQDGKKIQPTPICMSAMLNMK